MTRCAVPELRVSFRVNSRMRRVVFFSNTLFLRFVYRNSFNFRDTHTNDPCNGCSGEIP
jgi:hypothetical protein